jgi:hypothetical protein
MNSFTTFLRRITGLLLLLGLLSGCALGTRRLRDQPNPAALPTTASAATLPSSANPAGQPTGEPGQPTNAAAAAALPATATTTVKAASASAADPSGQDLLNQINTLDAANQAGDRFEDLPQ